jgi:hypothetical protein
MSIALETLKKVVEKVTNMMKKDKILDKKEIDDTIKSVKLILSSEVYVKKIESEISNIISGGVIGLNDIPAMVRIIIDSKDLIYQILKTDDCVSLKIMKYIIFAIIYYMIINGGKITDFENKILDNYESVWNLLSYNPINLLKKNETSCINYMKNMIC